MKSKISLLAGVAALSGLSATPAVAADWWENTSISGRMYYDLTSIDQTTHTAAGVKAGGPPSGTMLNGTGFDIKRFYIGIDHKFNDTFSANITTDTQYSSAISSSDIFIKTAYLQAKFSPALAVRVGAAPLPWIPLVEGIYGYRYVENLIVDRTKNGTTTDWGAHAGGDFWNGLLSYQFSAVNGNGYKNPSRGDQMDFEGRISLNYAGFVAAIGGYDGKLGAAHGTTTYHDATRFDALIAYVGNGARLGVEYFDTNDWRSVKTVATDKAVGVSAFASYEFMPEWALFGRYDYVNPKQNGLALSPTVLVTNPSVKDNYFNIGVQYQPAKMVNFALVYKHEKVTGGNLVTAEGTLGGSVFGSGAASEGEYSEAGLFGSLQW